MNEQLIVKNFGPIKDATVNFKKVTVFIGPTGGGKSTLAKLAAILKDLEFYSASEEKEFEFFTKYSIRNFFNSSSHITWHQNEDSILIMKDKIGINETLKLKIDSTADTADNKAVKSILDHLKKIIVDNNISSNDDKYDDFLRNEVQNLINKNIIAPIYEASLAQTKPSYIPSERTFLPAIEYSWAGILRDDIGLPKNLLDFANSFSLARREVIELDIPIFNVKYIHTNGRDFIKIPEREEPLMLLETASGIQSVTPLLVLLEHLSRNTEHAQSFIIEEPELNLYPTAQQGLLNWLVEKCTKGENDLTITTHSPYILSHINLLLYAYQVAEKHPDRADDVAKIVPRESWINPKEFTCYHVEGQKDNGVHSIVNPETGLISYNDLDALAGNSATEFDQLLDINAGLEV